MNIAENSSPYCLNISQYLESPKWIKLTNVYDKNLISLPI